jgi:peroxiredoxin Q/BCP
LPSGGCAEGQKIRENVAGAEAVVWEEAISAGDMKLLFVALLLLGGLVVVVKAVSNKKTNGKLKIGDLIPAVAAEDQDGNLVSLPEAGSSGYTLVYFYPKAMTPGCTAQACSLRDAYTELQSKGVRIFGVSLDTVDSQKKFREKEHLPFVLLSDRDKKVTSAFGVPLIMNSLATRQAYLFKDGKLVWMDSHASTDKQASDVLGVLAQQP